MKKHFIKLVVFTVLMVMLGGELFCMEQYQNYDSIYKMVQSDFMSKSEFQRDYKENPQKALEKVRAKADWLYNMQFKKHSSKSTSAYGDDQIVIGRDSFPRFKQSTSYYCGPASALTALYFQGTANRVEGRGYDEKQDTLAREARTDRSGTLVYRLTDTINRYSRSRYFYDTKLSVKEIDDLIYDSLKNGNAPILHALMEKMPYYRGRSGGHYVTIIYYDWRTPPHQNGLDVMDNNYDDRYFGVNSIALEDVYDMLWSDRYIIAAPGRK